MSTPFRLVILDYPKLLLDNKDAMRIFNDAAISKQKGFERSSADYVSLDSLDMISSHVLIYDTDHIFNPKPVLAIRICYENRARRHNLTLPIENYIHAVPPSGQKAFKALHSKKENLVDCNAWFVDPEYTFSKTGVPLSDIAFFAVATTILRKGADHLVGCSNEKFKASRWVNHIGNLIEPVTFVHPKVTVPHQLVLIDGFSSDWLLKCFETYKKLVESRMEFFPAANGESRLLSIDELYMSLIREPELPAAA